MNRATVVHTPEGPVLDMPCTRYGRCYPAPPVTRGPASDTGPRGRIWQWIGSEEEPTISPSVGCDAKCGAHRTITNGSYP